LPKRSVLEVTCKIRAGPALAWVPVIVVTSLEPWDDDRLALRLGCGAYISRSFRQRDLFRGDKEVHRLTRVEREARDLEPFGSRPGPSQEGGERDGR